MDRRVGMTLEQVGEVLGVSPERVRQIEQRALAKLRRRKPKELAELARILAERDRDWVDAHTLLRAA